MNENMEIVFGGTGTSVGVPVIGCSCDVCCSTDFKDKRFRASIYLKTPDLALVIDIGPDFRMQMLNNNIKKLNAALLTHFHKDHIAGLDDIKPFIWDNHRSFDLYANRKTLDVIHSEFSYVFKHLKYPGLPEFELHKIEKKTFTINNTVITPIPVMHHQLGILGFRIFDFAYITDASCIPDHSMSLLKNLKILVLNSLRKSHHIAHFSLSEALHVVEQFSPEITYLTHISHELGLHQIVSKKLPNNVFLAFDGLKITI